MIGGLEEMEEWQEAALGQMAGHDEAEQQDQLHELPFDNVEVER